MLLPYSDLVELFDGLPQLVFGVQLDRLLLVLRLDNQLLELAHTDGVLDDVLISRLEGNLGPIAEGRLDIFAVLGALGNELLHEVEDLLVDLQEVGARVRVDVEADDAG